MATLPTDANERVPCPGPCTTEGPALTLSLATPSMGVESAGLRGHAHVVLPYALPMQVPECPAQAALSLLPVSAQVLGQVHIPKDSELPKGSCLPQGYGQSLDLSSRCPHSCTQGLLWQE